MVALVVVFTFLVLLVLLAVFVAILVLILILILVLAAPPFPLASVLRRELLQQQNVLVVGRQGRAVDAQQRRRVQHGRAARAVPPSLEETAPHPHQEEAADADDTPVRPTAGTAAGTAAATRLLGTLRLICLARPVCIRTHALFFHCRVA